MCKILRSLYGFKQSARRWYIKFVTFLKKTWLCTSQIRKLKERKLLLAIYIDDRFFAAESAEDADQFLLTLQKEYEITELEANMILDLQIVRNSDYPIFLHQKNYAEKILERFRMKNARNVIIPVEPHQETSIGTNSVGLQAMNAPYRETVGSFMCKASKYLENPTKM